MISLAWAANLLTSQLAIPSTDAADEYTTPRLVRVRLFRAPEGKGGGAPSPAPDRNRRCKLARHCDWMTARKRARFLPNRVGRPGKSLISAFRVRNKLESKDSAKRSVGPPVRAARTSALAAPVRPRPLVALPRLPSGRLTTCLRPRP